MADNYKLTDAAGTDNSQEDGTAGQGGEPMDMYDATAYVRHALKDGPASMTRILCPGHETETRAALRCMTDTGEALNVSGGKTDVRRIAWGVVSYAWEDGPELECIEAPAVGARAIISKNDSARTLAVEFEICDEWAPAVFYRDTARGEITALMNFMTCTRRELERHAASLPGYSVNYGADDGRPWGWCPVSETWAAIGRMLRVGGCL
ncbi:hypothetical protein ACLUWO_08790 [Pseudoscardovia radai]|uniref:hypothetical protein n=1 Tax=Pseudoscardovia radai TaxID=987066 RepID=UPI0039910EB1